MRSKPRCLNFAEEPTEQISFPLCIVTGTLLDSFGLRTIENHWTRTLILGFRGDVGLRAWIHEYRACGIGGDICLERKVDCTNFGHDLWIPCIVYFHNTQFTFSALL